MFTHDYFETNIFTFCVWFVSPSFYSSSKLLLILTNTNAHNTQSFPSMTSVLASGVVMFNVYVEFHFLDNCFYCFTEFKMRDKEFKYHNGLISTRTNNSWIKRMYLLGWSLLFTKKKSKNSLLLLIRYIVIGSLLNPL